MRKLFSWRWLTPTAWVYFLVHLLLVVGGYLLMKNEKLSGVGASLVAAGVTGIVVFVYVRSSQSAFDRLRMIGEFGIVSIFDARAARIKSEYDQRLQSARHIDVMGFGLRAFREDYRYAFRDWSQRCHVRVLLLDPAFPRPEVSYALQRENEEGDTAGSIEASVEAFLRDTDGLRGTASDSPFQVRLYHCLPALNIFRVDDEIFWGPYLIGGPSRNNPTFIVKRGGVLYARLIDHFDRIWRDMSTPV